ncbi:MAG: hypothetical protein EKK42_24480 [Pseudonocardiaceae bacterium]|nr:MAG: hypothetical protein EKK42_24480 [Pseudonocardiaceae bacterium]
MSYADTVQRTVPDATDELLRFAENLDGVPFGLSTDDARDFSPNAAELLAVLADHGLARVDDDGDLELLTPLPGQEPADNAPSEPPAPQAPTTRAPTREVDFRTAVMDYPGKLSTGARYAGVCIGRHCFRSWEFFASQGQLAEWMGLSPSSRKTTGGYVAELVEAGFLTPIGSHRRTTRYALTIPVVADTPPLDTEPC